jgi:hypothetical protein
LKIYGFNKYYSKTSNELNYAVESINRFVRVGQDNYRQRSKEVAAAKISYRADLAIHTHLESEGKGIETLTTFILDKIHNSSRTR